MDENKKYEYTLPLKTAVINGGEIPGEKGKHFQYHVEEVLGQGGFGITYKVWAIYNLGQTPVKSYFAMKEHFVKGRCHRGADGVTVEYSEEAREDVENSLKDFIKEGRLLHDICQVKNPQDPKNAGWKYVVPVNEVIEANNTAYYIMQYLDGGSLYDLVHNRRKPLDEQHALAYMVPILQAVGFLHRHGILHMDIKPQNIVLRHDLATQHEEPVLIDFGVSLHFDRRGELTTTHTNIGHSDGFSPIEQYGIIEAFQPKVDIYALGATLFYLLVGRKPRTAFEMTGKLIEESLPDNVSERTRLAIIHAMQRDAAVRTPTTDDFSLELADRVTLTVGSVLQSPNEKYLLTKIVHIAHQYIKYEAVRYTGNAYDDDDRDVTQTIHYTIYEYFLKDQFRRETETRVERNGHPLAGEEMETYMKRMKLRTALTASGQVHMSGQNVQREMFEANGTRYTVVDKVFRPASLLQQTMGWLGKKSGQAGHILRSNVRPVITCAVALAVVVLAFVVGPNIKKLFMKTDVEWSNQLSKAIEQQDEEMMTAFFMADSVRVMLPLINYYMQHGNMAKARTVAQRALLADSLTAARASALIEKMDKTGGVTDVADSTSTEQGSSINNQQAMEKPTVKQATEISKTEMTQEKETTEEEKNKKESRKETSQAENARLALHYVNGERTENNHAKALQYALKADASTRAKVIQKLKSMDYPPAFNY